MALRLTLALVLDTKDILWALTSGCGPGFDTTLAGGHANWKSDLMLMTVSGHGE